MMLERNPGATLPSGPRLRRARAALRFLGRARSILAAVSVGRASIIDLALTDSGGVTGVTSEHGLRDKENGESAALAVTSPIPRALSSIRAAMVAANLVSRRVKPARLEHAAATPESHTRLSARRATDWPERPGARLSRSPRPTAGISARQVAAPRRISLSSTRATLALARPQWREGATRFHRASRTLSYSSTGAAMSPLPAAMIQVGSASSPISKTQILRQGLSGFVAFMRALPVETELHAIRHMGMTPSGHLDAALARRTLFAASASPTAPALAAESSRRRGAEPARTGSFVINSTPTVVIHAERASDIESRVLEVLRQHRVMLFDQWQREAQRRQRTEF